ncbi:SNF2-family helicase [Cellulophaga phage phi14:2]|uniref:DNA helicase n=1 Tax=Cellulophaga phage phi14:2 TaxID=1327990 RepID=S0A2B5_9CAUD|nr:SNF2-family helicase [Cellulophaga phage phi14:2]AGO48945.1 DNA helicase [Cellulophaga phage phi14:2]
MTENKRDSIQRKAVKKWIDNGKVGTCEIITGLGKTFIALHCLSSMPINDKIHLFLAETTNRKKDLIDDIIKYDNIFGTNLLDDYKLRFYCYQTVYKWKDRNFGLVICDEIHDQLSPSYVRFHENNSYDAILGLSATITRNTKYEDENGKYFTKGALLNKYCPVIFKYSVNQAQIDETSRKLNVNVISHSLDEKEKNIVSGSKKNPFMQTEKAAYDYWNKEFAKAFYIDNDDVRDFKIRIASHKRSNILYNLKSKVPVVKELLKLLPDKTIIFGNSIDALLEVTPNVVSSRNKEDVNDNIRRQFEKGDINVIGSFKKLKQGANLSGLDNCIIMSYYSTEKDLIQRLGRLRINADKVGTVFIIVTKNTKEQDWYDKMFEGIDVFDIKEFSSVQHYVDYSNNIKKS